MRNAFVFFGWTFLLVIVALSGIAFYKVSTSDGSDTYEQLGYDTGRYFIEVLFASIIVVVLGKRFSFLPGFKRRKPNTDSPTAHSDGNAT